MVYDFFRKRNYDLPSDILPYKDYVAFARKTYTVAEHHRESLLKTALSALSEEIPSLYATEYMMFRRDGNRSIFEKKYFRRRQMLLELAVAEHVEGKGRFADRLADLVWLVCEETTWVVPAHNKYSVSGQASALPCDFRGETDYIDLFSAATGAILAVVYFLCKDALDGASPLLCERILRELDRRIVRPFLIEENLDHFWWTGRTSRVNNWCPWIVSSILTVAAFTVEEQAQRVRIVENALPMLDAFISTYGDDGGCEEGPMYWSHAVGALFNASDILFDMTGGRINAFDDPLFRRMGEYVVYMTATEDHFFTYGDTSVTASPNARGAYRFGLLCGSETMTAFAAAMRRKDPLASPIHHHAPFLSLRTLSEPILPDTDFVAPSKFLLKDLGIAGTRESSRLGEGLLLYFKGGHNGESHNHNDLGSFALFDGRTPLFIDVGKPVYTAKVFNEHRYEIWSTCSDYHNCATLNGVTQVADAKYHATVLDYDEVSGALTLDLTEAYPAEASLRAYRRTAKLQSGVFTLTDDISFKESGSVSFSLMTREAPRDMTESGFSIGKRRVSFDPSLKLSVEVCEGQSPETMQYTQDWNTDAIYRIRLTGVRSVAHACFVMTVS